jgi:hypothetical protein
MLRWCPDLTLKAVHGPFIVTGLSMGCDDMAYPLLLINLVKSYSSCWHIYTFYMRDLYLSDGVSLLIQELLPYFSIVPKMSEQQRYILCTSVLP